jgi:lysophospholipase L1-like esterase
MPRQSFRRRLWTAAALAGCVLLASCGSTPTSPHSLGSAHSATTTTIPSRYAKLIEEAPLGIPPWKPAKRTTNDDITIPGWYQEVVALRRSVIHDPGADLVFLGDSIMQRWLSVGASSWNREYAPHHALDLGLSGDTTQNVLWRIYNGELNGLHPKTLVLLIGTNDYHHGWSADLTGSGVVATVDAVHVALPQTTIVLVGVLPRDDPGTPDRLDVTETDKKLAATHFSADVVYRDLSSLFLGPGGELAPGLYGSDALHPSAAGYEVLATALDRLPAVTAALSKPS